MKSRYTIDPVHSSVGFSIRHFVAKVPGTFTKVSGTILADRNHLEDSQIEATIAVGSLHTAHEGRDGHLKSPDFFDAETFPEISVKSKSWKRTSDDTFDVRVDLTLKGVTREAVLKVTALGFGTGMEGAELSGWEATAKIKRSDFGLTGPAMLGSVLGDEVVVTVAIEAVLAK